MDTQRQNLDLEIGTVEPIISDDVFGFIMGAIQKYKDNPDYHKSLSKYIMQQLNQRELANPVENRVSQAVSQALPEPNASCEKNVCDNCKHLGGEGDCENLNEEIEGLIDLGSLDTSKFGCIFFEQK